MKRKASPPTKSGALISRAWAYKLLRYTNLEVNTNFQGVYEDILRRLQEENPA